MNVSFTKYGATADLHGHPPGIQKFWNPNQSGVDVIAHCANISQS